MSQAVVQGCMMDAVLRVSMPGLLVFWEMVWSNVSVCCSSDMCMFVVWQVAPELIWQSPAPLRLAAWDLKDLPMWRLFLKGAASGGCLPLSLILHAPGNNMEWLISCLKVTGQYLQHPWNNSLLFVFVRRPLKLKSFYVKGILSWALHSTWWQLSSFVRTYLDICGLKVPRFLLIRSLFNTFCSEKILQMNFTGAIIGLTLTFSNCFVYQIV